MTKKELLKAFLFCWKRERLFILFNKKKIEKNYEEDMRYFISALREEDWKQSSLGRGYYKTDLKNGLDILAIPKYKKLILRERESFDRVVAISVIDWVELNLPIGKIKDVKKTAIICCSLF